MGGDRAQCDVLARLALTSASRSELSSNTFQVDLRGVVELLSHNLYSSPRVFVRELLQNAVDAVVARQLVQPNCPTSTRFDPPAVTGDGTLRVTDTGIGLTGEQMHELLATIGRSSKRDELDLARTEFLGQFGIGLLSCFLVADEITVRSRSAVEGSSTMLWRGRSDGTYEVTEAAEPLTAPGSEVVLTPRNDDAFWFDSEMITDLASTYGSLLPVPVLIGAPGGDRLVSAQTPPWQLSRADASDWCQATFGFRPLDIVRLEVPGASIDGVAFVLPVPANPATTAKHRVYLKNMLLSESAEGLLPDWAFFVRCVVNSDQLRPTASREALYEDVLLLEAVDSLGGQLRDWLVRLQTVNPSLMRRFIEIHHLGVKAMAMHDDDMLELVRDQVPFETSQGTVTLAEFHRTFDSVRYAQTVDEFRALAGVATAHGYGLVNAGYTYALDILLRLAERDGWNVAQLNAAELSARMGVPSAADELAARPMLRAVSAVLDGRDCDVVLREFEPMSLPALYLPDPEANSHAVREAADEVVDDDLWASVLTAVDPQLAAPRAQFVLNYANPLVRRLTTLADQTLAGEVGGGLYVQALTYGRHPLRPADTALLNSTFLSLIDRAL